MSDDVHSTDYCAWCNVAFPRSATGAIDRSRAVDTISGSVHMDCFLTETDEEFYLWRKNHEL